MFIIKNTAINPSLITHAEVQGTELRVHLLGNQEAKVGFSSVMTAYDGVEDLVESCHLPLFAGVAVGAKNVAVAEIRDDGQRAGLELMFTDGSQTMIWVNFCSDREDRLGETAMYLRVLAQWEQNALV